MHEKKERWVTMETCAFELAPVPTWVSKYDYVGVAGVAAYKKAEKDCQAQRALLKDWRQRRDVPCPRIGDFMTDRQKAAFQRADEEAREKNRKQRAAWKKRLGAVFVAFDLDVVPAPHDNYRWTKRNETELDRQLHDLNSRAWAIVRSSFDLFGQFQVQTYVGHRRVHVEVKFSDSGLDFLGETDTPASFVKDNYGIAAADTWMEGDIHWLPLCELHLKVHGAPRCWTEPPTTQTRRSRRKKNAA